MPDTDGRPDRHEFRVVLDGVTLDDRQNALIATAVQKAAFETLTSLDLPLEGPVVIAPGIAKFPEWLGIWILDKSAAFEVGEKIRGLPQFEQKHGG